MCRQGVPLGQGITDLVSNMTVGEQMAKTLRGLAAGVDMAKSTGADSLYVAN